MILSAALAITNAVLFVVCRACSGCWDWLEPVPTGAFAERVSNQAEPKKGPKATLFNVVLGGGQECSGSVTLITYQSHAGNKLPTFLADG